jgi:hypothetical protein
MGLWKLDERNTWDRKDSIRHCADHFGAYGKFATLPLRTCLLSKEECIYPGTYHTVFDGADYEPHVGARNIEYIKNLDFDDSDFFTLDEYRILLKINGGIYPRSGAKLCCDRAELECFNPTEMCSEHAKALLKALDLWVLRYDDKYEEWNGMYQRAYDIVWRGGWRMQESRDIEEDEGFFEAEPDSLRSELPSSVISDLNMDMFWI